MKRLREPVTSRSINKTEFCLIVALIMLPFKVWSTSNTQHFDTHCKHCHNKSTQNTFTENIRNVDGILRAKESEIPLTEFLKSHYLVLQAQQLQALVDELNRVADELGLGSAKPEQ